PRGVENLLATLALVLLAQGHNALCVHNELCFTRILARNVRPRRDHQGPASPRTFFPCVLREALRTISPGKEMFGALELRASSRSESYRHGGRGHSPSARR